MKNICCFLFLLTSIVNAQNIELSQLDTFFDLLYENDKMMGSVSVIKEGNILYQKSIGFQHIAENEKSILNSKKTKYRIGSITKTFTATLIFQLLDEEKIKLDDKLSIYFPEIPSSDLIKISNLLNHSSGLFNITADETFDETVPNSKDQMLERIRNYELQFNPGTKHEYSNTNFILLGFIIEKIENETYDAVLKNRIVEKIGLTNTYVGSKIDVTSNEGLSYYYEDDLSLHEANQANMSNPGGAGALVSNPTDLILFFDALFSDRLISKESFATMTTINNEYGSGIFSTKIDGIEIFAHNGTIDFFKSMVAYIPSLKIGVALNANALDYNMMPIMFNIFDVLKGQKITMPKFENVALSDDDLSVFVGTYQCNEVPFDLNFETDGKILKGAPVGENLKDLTAVGEKEFSLNSLGILLRFNPSDETVLFTMAGETPKTFTKIK